MKQDLFKQALKKDWYIQGFNAVPLLLNAATLSGFTMKKQLGFGYESFLLKYKNGYCEMGYLNNDFDRIWNIIKDKLSKDQNYLVKNKNKHEKNFAKLEVHFKKINNKKLVGYSDKELLSLFKFVAQALIDGVGIAHSIEPIGIHLEKEFKQELMAEVGNTVKFNEYYSLLSTPTKPSFLNIEETDLKRINDLSPDLKEKKLISHAKKYFWIKNSYAGAHEVTVQELYKRLEELKSSHKDWKTIRKDKIDLIKSLNLSSKIQSTIHMIDFVTLWQDERKMNILKSIGYMERVVLELSRRMGLEKDVFHYMGVTEVLKLKSLSEIKDQEQEFKNRKEGVLFISSDARELIASGNEYKALVEEESETAKNKSSDEPIADIHGSIANRGTAVGRVVICRDLSMLDKVKEGDILVTSMTRPEFMPALRKAQAIITDEGGITCHAAIVARELNIPAIIGTRIATKILQDGMMVEVRANHGLVRIVRS